MGLTRDPPRHSMGKLKKYDCHKQKYYIPQNKPSWSLLKVRAKEAAPFIPPRRFYFFRERPPPVFFPKPKARMTRPPRVTNAR